MTKHVKIYTDGACSGNPGPGGFAAILLYKDVEKIVSGFEPHTTNNRMELRAAIEGLKLLKDKVVIDLYTDSKYLQDGITKWIHSWKKNGWKRKNGEILNTDLWKELDKLVAHHQIKFHWVKSHAGDYYNERADEAARQAIIGKYEYDIK